MTLSFSINKEDSIAFTEQYLKGSISHQKLRSRTRWALPIIMLSFFLIVVSGHGFHISALIIFGGFSLFWFFAYPKRFDSNVRKQSIKQMSESSYSKSYGAYSLKLDSYGLRSSGPLGEATYAWGGVDRAELTDEYLYIFLTGPMGYPIRTSLIGQKTAIEASSFIAKHLKQTTANKTEIPTASRAEVQFSDNLNHSTHSKDRSR